MNLHRMHQKIILQSVLLGFFIIIFYDTDFNCTVVYRGESQLKPSFYRTVMFPEWLTVHQSGTEHAHLVQCHLFHMGIPGVN